MSKSIEYIRDASVLGELHLSKWQWGVENGSGALLVQDGNVECGFDRFDNSRWDCDFDETVEIQKKLAENANSADSENANSSGKSVQTASSKPNSESPMLVKNVLHGDIRLMELVCTEYPEHIGYASRDGRYRYRTGRGCVQYPGWEGRARCIAIPQCKMMNSTVLDEYAIHKVVCYPGGRGLWSKRWKGAVGIGKGEVPIYKWDNSKPRGKRREVDEDALEGWANGRQTATHLPFDLFAFIGCVFGKVLHVGNAFFKGKFKGIPKMMYVSVEEVFETLNPGHRWSECRTKEVFAEWCARCAVASSEVVLDFDLPEFNVALGKFERTRKRWFGLVDFDCVYPSRHYGDMGKVAGFKVNLGNSPLFDFCFMGRGKPRVVQIPCQMLDTRGELGAKSTKRALHTLYVAWLVMYRNYWIKNNAEFPTCKRVWSFSEMKRAFEGCHFDFGSSISLECMEKIMRRFSEDYHRQHPELKWGALFDTFEKVEGKRAYAWELRKTLKDEPLYLKGENEGDVYEFGKLSKNAQADADIVDALNDIVEVNKENERHFVSKRNGTRVRTGLSAIGRACINAVTGEVGFVKGEYFRNYTHFNGYQSLSSQERLELKIDGKQVCELDFSALHPTMLYALNGINIGALGKDLYDFGNWYAKYGISREEARDLAKKGLLTYVNAKNLYEAQWSIKSEWNLAHGRKKDAYVAWFSDFDTALRKTHRQILGAMCSGVGTKLQFMDGKMIRKVCRRLCAKGVCALPVHDSIIVQQKYSSVCEQIMQEEYAIAVGNPNFVCKIKKKQK